VEPGARVQGPNAARIGAGEGVDPEPLPASDPAPTRRRESLLFLLLALLVGVAVVGRPLVDPGRVYLALDCATVQAPWSVEPPAANPELSDSAVAFYPHYRRLSERWRGGELPLWNPDLFAGVPLLANMQWGALDPQVGVLVALEALGGRAAFDIGFAWLAALRVAAALFGAALLARRLGLGSAGSAFAGVAFALSGSLTLWLGFSLAHVTPLLPWMLLGVEGLRDGESPRRSFALAAVSLALAIYGGHPEVAAFVGLSAGLWSLSLFARSPRAAFTALASLATGVLLAAPALVPFLEYLAHSGALVAHRLAPSPRAMPDLWSLAALAFFLAFLWRWRRWSEASASPALASGVLALAWLGLGFVLAGRGAQLDPALAPCGELEVGSARLPVPAAVLALAALCGGGASRRERWLLGLGAGSWLLGVSAPGVVDLWRWLPLVGLGAPQRAASCAALFLALGAGGVLERSRPAARAAGLGAFVALALVSFARAPAAPLAPERAQLDPRDEYVLFDALPPEVLEGTSALLAGRLLGGLELDELRLVCERLGRGGEVLERAGFEPRAELEAGDAPGETRFDFGELPLGSLGAGDWLLRLELYEEGARLGGHRALLLHRPAPAVADAEGLAVLVLTALALLRLAGSRRAWVLVALAAWQGVALARDWNPAVPLARGFGPTLTTTLLDERYAGERVLAEAGILPGDSVLLTRASTIGGYDAMDVASFDGFRAHALRPGRNPLLDWDADGVDLESAAFRLFGVRVLLTHAPRELEGWRLVAGPRGAPAEAEVHVYEAVDPLPRSFCVPRLVEREAVLRAPAAFDPRSSAFLEGPASLELEAPFSESRVRELSRTPEVLEFEVELDGEGLFVSTEQHFPGWRVTVDGAPRELLRVDSIFRGVYLAAGRHELRFEYAPESWRRGKLLGLVGLAGLLVGLFLAGPRPSVRAEPHGEEGLAGPHR